MCAVALNDLRSVRLLVREGADPNHPNRNGSTALMVAAQLNNIESLVELLLLGADTSLVDNEGYTALAYASSLPLPTCMHRNSVGVIMEDDVDGVKRVNASVLLKTAVSGGIDDMKALLEENKLRADPNTVEAHFRILRLLEKYVKLRK